MPRVSIGMPVYNGEQYVGSAIESMLAQDFADFELIISDNASTDGTHDICVAFAKRDARVKYVRAERNQGAAANFNHVFKLAVGEYFKWAAHDDVCAPTYVRRCVEVMEQSPSDVVLVYGKTIVIDERGQIVGPYEDKMDLSSTQPDRRFEYLLRYLELCNAQMGLYRRQVLATTRLHRPFPSSDTILLAELALRGRFVEIPEPLYFRRLHSGRSLEANRTAEALTLWFDPNWRGKVAFPRLRRFGAHMLAIYEAPLNWRERFACTRVLFRERFAHDQEWRRLVGELYWGMRKRLKYLLGGTVSAARTKDAVPVSAADKIRRVRN